MPRTYYTACTICERHAVSPGGGILPEGWRTFAGDYRCCAECRALFRETYTCIFCGVAVVDEERPHGWRNREGRYACSQPSCRHALQASRTAFANETRDARRALHEEHLAIQPEHFGLSYGIRHYITAVFHYDPWYESRIFQLTGGKPIDFYT